ncbi:MAG: thioredoxin domain-containing protein [Bacteroidota bacterium]|nr:thioredoxin domain-containing protein [Bacteroidota bacterium]
MQPHKYTNLLIHETSPYLLQHAHNPVDWHPWTEETLLKAKKENKLILISIGYSACHWCHVMEHESFEDESVAELMNKNFINIKIDREERPDIDQVYMTAVQLMTQQGGWPLNCIALPDGRPVYGGTYFPKEKWMHVLQSISDIHQNDYEKVANYAKELTNGMLKSESIYVDEVKEGITKEIVEKSVSNWKKLFDHEEGGMSRAPKFPLPNNYLFLLQYAHLTKDAEAMKHLHFTLQKMAFGGIYDQLGGGFARYSVDAEWKIPHFEKMLYDNAQLITLYSQAYRETKTDLYKQVVYDTIAFIERELKHEKGYLYSALDADSEGVEGKYYVWQQAEIETLLEGRTLEVFCEFYNINDIGYWEHDNYILLRKETEKQFCLRKQITEDELVRELYKAKNVLVKTRDKRVRPGLDDKTLCSWNALMITGYSDAYKAIPDPDFFKRCGELCVFIEEQMTKNGVLFHSYKNGKAKINGFLEDYTFVIEGYLNYYEISGVEEWLKKAKSLCEYTIQHFYDKTSGFFYFTSDEDEGLIVRKTEISDNVIPASNSQMARNMLKLHHYLHLPDLEEKAKRMCFKLQDEISHYVSGYSNWAMLACEILFPYKEIAIVGKDSKQLFETLNENYLPNCLFAMSEGKSDLPLIKDRFVEGKTVMYVCENNTCKLPVENVSAVLGLLK